MKRILIIEDEESIAELEKDYLELSGFEVEVANDGETGLEKALKDEYSLFILDLMLPGVDGFEICKKIREEKNTPIIMVSAKKDDIDKIRGLGLGADDYMTKPFSPSELVARVKAHMARYERLVGSGVQENEIIEIRGIKIDKTARRVWVNGEEKAFTSKEFDLLTFLAQNPNHVFTKEELFSKIWDMESIGDIATVTVHIKKIRASVYRNNLGSRLPVQSIIRKRKAAGLRFVSSCSLSYRVRVLFVEKSFEKAFFRLWLFKSASGTFNGGDVDAADYDFNFLFHRKQIIYSSVSYKGHNLRTNLGLYDRHLGSAQIPWCLIDHHLRKTGFFHAKFFLVNDQHTDCLGSSI